MKRCKDCNEYTCGAQGSNGVSSICGRDCKNCVNCDMLWGFMCTCRYSYDTEEGYHQAGQDVHRSKANSCEYYTETRDKRKARRQLTLDLTEDYFT